MKKILLTLLVLVSFATSYGQTKWHEKQNNHFVEAAAKEYALNDEQKQELATTRLDMVKAFIESNQEFKDGGITQDEKKEKNRAASQKFNSYFSQLVGKPYKEVAPFMKKMREELKNM